MATPVVTITVGGKPITASTTSVSGGPLDPETLKDHLYMTYVQAVKGEKREQWVLFPPAIKELGINEDKMWTGSGNRFLYIHRKQERVGNRSKWFSAYFYSDHSHTLAMELENRAGRGYEIGGVVVVPLELDDYLTVYNDGATPHKALRHVATALKPLGLTVK